MAILVLGLATLGAHAADEPELRLVGGEEARTVTLKANASGTEATGTATVLVRNDSGKSGELEVVLVSSKGQASVTVDPPKPVPEIGPRSVLALKLNFTATSADPESPPTLAGTLVVRFANDQGIRPAVVEVKAGAGATATFEQKGAKFTVTRIFGPIPRFLDEIAPVPFSFDKVGVMQDADEPVTGLLNGKADVGLRNAAGLTSDPVTEALLNADNGRVLRAQLHPPDGNGNGLWRGLIDVTNVSRTGEYTGNLLLDPSDPESSAAELTVRVQDFILWPVAVLFLGAGLGGYGRKRFELWRERLSLQRKLQEAVDAYDEAYAERSNNIKTLNDRLGEPGSDTALRRWDCSDKKRDVTNAYCGAGEAKDVDKLAAANKTVEALIGDIERWLALNSALKALRAAIKAMPSARELRATESEQIEGGERDLARRDADQLLPGPPDLDDDEFVGEYTARASRHAAVLGFFAAAWREHRELHDKLPPNPGPDYAEALDALRRNDPRVVYASSSREFLRTEKSTKRLLVRLLHAARELAWQQKHLPRPSAPPPPVGERTDDEWTAHARAEQLSYKLLGTGALDLRRLPIGDPLALVDAGRARSAVADVLGEGTEEPPLPPKVPTPAEIKARVRSWDRKTFWLVAIVTAVAYMIPLYIGKSFGDWDDYLSAFAAGFAGTAVIPWELLPSFRSDAGGKDKAGDTKEGAAAAAA